MAEQTDITAIEELQKDLARIRRVSIGRLAERGYQLLRAEVPVATGNLKQGVAPPGLTDPIANIGRSISEGGGGRTTVNYAAGTATLTVSARSGRRGPRSATLHLKSGKTREVQLRPQPSFNYAGVVATGRPAMRAKEAKALLIPVGTAPKDEAYLEMNGQFYVMRKSAKATKANPFHERAGKKLEGEAVAITEAVIKKVMNG